MEKLLDEPTQKKFSDLEKENECLKKSLEEMSLKCHKMEQAEEDSERLINEQTKLMKALNVRNRANIFALKAFFIKCTMRMFYEILRSTQ